MMHSGNKKRINIVRIEENYLFPDTDIITGILRISVLNTDNISEYLLIPEKATPEHLRQVLKKIFSKKDIIREKISVFDPVLSEYKKCINYPLIKSRIKKSLAITEGFSLENHLFPSGIKYIYELIIDQVEFTYSCVFIHLSFPEDQWFGDTYFYEEEE